MLSSLKLSSVTSIGKEEAKKLRLIWQSIQDNDDSIEFRHPVEWEKIGLFDYLNIVKNPMDLNTIHCKFVDNKYESVEEMLDDLQLIWDNCKIYNELGSWIYDLADKLEKLFKRLVKINLPGIELPRVTAKSSSRQDEEEIKSQDKIKFVDRIRYLKPEELGILVSKIIELCPKAFKQGDGEKAQIIVDLIDSASFGIALETLENLESCDDSLSKRQKC